MHPIRYLLLLFLPLTAMAQFTVEQPFFFQQAASGFPTAGLIFAFSVSDTNNVKFDLSGNLTNWLDTSGNNRHMTNDSVTYAPLFYSQGGPTNGGRVNFGGTTKYLFIPAPFGSNVTVAIVHQSSTANLNGTIIGEYATDNTHIGYEEFWNPASLSFYFGGATRRLVGGGRTTNWYYSVWVIDYENGAGMIRTNGAVMVTNAITKAAVGGGTSLIFGCSGTAQRQFIGNICGLWAWSRHLSDAEISQVEIKLKNEFGF